MPFQSKAQRRWMYATHPEMAKRWEKETPEGRALPEHVDKSAVFVEAFFDELEKIAAEHTRLGKTFLLRRSKDPATGKPTAGLAKRFFRGALAKTLGVTRKLGAPGRAIAELSDAPSPLALAGGGAAFLAGQPIPFPLVGTVAGPTVAMALQPRRTISEFGRQFARSQRAQLQSTPAPMVTQLTAPNPVNPALMQPHYGPGFV